MEEQDGMGIFTLRKKGIEVDRVDIALFVLHINCIMWQEIELVFPFLPGE